MPLYMIWYMLASVVATHPFKVTMFRSTAVMLLFTVSAHSNEIRLSEIVTMVTEVIVNITTSRSGIVDCWFYTAYPDPQPDELLEMILQQSVLRSTPIRILKQVLPRRPRRRQTILIMDLRLVQTNPQLVPSIKRMLSKSTNIVVFIDGSSFHYFSVILFMFINAGLLNVFYIRTDVSQNYYVNNFARRFVAMKTFPSVMFPDQVRDMNGYIMSVSQVYSDTNAAFNSAGQSLGPAIDWLRITTQYINVSYYMTIVECGTAAECNTKSETAPDGDKYDLCIDMLSLEQWMNTDDMAVQSVVPATEGLIAPRSTPIEIHELFLLPFKKEVWTVVILLLVVSGFLCQIFPNQFQNDLIMLTLCSFERTSLHRVKRLEKMIAISLIVFFFVLLSAYESLFISLLTNRPRLHNPRTVQDLLKAGISIEKHGNGSVDDELRPLVKEVDYTKTAKLDGYTAYNELQDSLRDMLASPENFDCESGKSRYVTLDYTRWKGFLFYFFADNSPLVDKFRFTQYVLEESGLFLKFKDTFEYYSYGSRRHQILVKRFLPSSVMLGLEQISPAWVILGLGLIISMVVLIVEWIWYMACKICSGRIHSGSVSPGNDIFIEAID